MLIFRQICGFLVQILPCAFLCMYPFYNNLKINKQNSNFIISSILILMVSLFTFVGVHSLPSEIEPYRYLMQDVIFYITLLFLLLFYIFVIKVTIYKKLFVFFIVMNYGFLIGMCQNLFFVSSVDGYMYPTDELLIRICINTVLFVPMLFLIKKIKKALQSLMDDKQWKHLWIVPAIFIFVVSLCYELPSHLNIVNYERISEIFMIVIIIYSLIIYIWIFSIIESNRKQSEEKLHLQMTVDNYRQISENAEQIKKCVMK